MKTLLLILIGAFAISCATNSTNVASTQKDKKEEKADKKRKPTSHQYYTGAGK